MSRRPGDDRCASIDPQGCRGSDSRKFPCFQATVGTRYADAKIVAGIGGAALPYVIGRLRRNYSLDKDKLGDPDAALAAMYYDTIVQDRSEEHTSELQSLRHPVCRLLLEKK